MWVVLKVLVLLAAVWVVAVAIVFALDHGGKPIHADAVVVLEGSRTRLPVGVRLVREGYAPLLVISRGVSKRREAQLCSGRERIPNVRVLCFVAEPNSTKGEAEYIGHLALRRHLERIDVVTSQFHVFRAGIVIRRCYHGRLRFVGASQEWWRLPAFAATETAKLAYQLTVDRDC